MHPQDGEAVGAKRQTAGSLPYSSDKGAQVAQAARWPSSVEAWRVGGSSPQQVIGIILS